MPEMEEPTVYRKPEIIHPSQAYARHIVSYQLQDMHPYLEDITGHLKDDDVTTAYGERNFPRLIDQLMMPRQNMPKNEAERLKSLRLSMRKRFQVTGDPEGVGFVAPKTLVEALRTVSDLVSNQEDKCRSVVTEAVPAITLLLDHEDVLVRKEAARAMACLATMLNGRKQMLASMALKDCPTIPQLANLLLTCQDEEAKANAGKAFQNIATARDGCQMIVNGGAVKAISQYLCGVLPELPQSETLAVCLLDLLRCLASVVFYAQNGARDLLGCSFVAKLTELLRRVPPGMRIPTVTAALSQETLRQGLRVLWAVGNEAKGRQEALAAEATPTVTSFLVDKDAKVRETAVCALNVLSLEIAGKKAILKSSIAAIAKILQSQKETQYLHQTAIQLARSASELPEFRLAFAREILAQIWLLERVFGVPAIAAVHPLLRDPKAVIRHGAASAVCHFLSSPAPDPPMPGDQIRVPPISPLEYVQQPALFAIEQCTGILADLLRLLILEQPIVGTKPKEVKKENRAVEEAREIAMACLEALTEVQKPRDELRGIFAEAEEAGPDGSEEVGTVPWLVNMIPQNLVQELKEMTKKGGGAAAAEAAAVGAAPPAVEVQEAPERLLAKERRLSATVPLSNALLQEEISTSSEQAYTLVHEGGNNKVAERLRLCPAGAGGTFVWERHFDPAGKRDEGEMGGEYTTAGDDLVLLPGYWRQSGETLGIEGEKIVGTFQGGNKEQLLVDSRPRWEPTQQLILMKE